MGSKKRINVLTKGHREILVTRISRGNARRREKALAIAKSQRPVIAAPPDKPTVTWRCRLCSAGNSAEFQSLMALLKHARSKHVATKQRRKQKRRWPVGRSAAWYAQEFDTWVIPPQRICNMDVPRRWSVVLSSLTGSEVARIVDEVNKGGRAFCKACDDASRTPAIPGESLCYFHQAK
jgi:hypothetical protein